MKIVNNDVIIPFSTLFLVYQEVSGISFVKKIMYSFITKKLLSF